MRLAVTLHLRDFVEVLPLVARFDVAAIHRLAGEVLDEREHAAVGQVAVVRRSQGRRRRSCPRRPASTSTGRARSGCRRRIDREGQDLAGTRRAVAEDDVAMDVGRPLRGPLVADEGREAAGVVGVLRGLDRALPGVAVSRRARRDLQGLRKLAYAEGRDDLERRLAALAFLDHFMPAAARRISQDHGRAADEHREQSHVVRVVGDDQEVEWPG